MDTIPGYHTTYIQCRRCDHKVGGVLPLNALVGKTHRLVCSKCGGRDVAVSMSWSWGDAPTAEVIGLQDRLAGRAG